jgi:hypothetical protein
MAKKKKTAKKKTAKKKSTSGTTRIKFLCSNGCKAQPKTVHLAPGQKVTLRAVNTDATMNFVKGSPFVSGADPISIAAGQTRNEVIGQKKGEFEYTLKCENPRCQSSVGNPKMIVP